MDSAAWGLVGVLIGGLVTGGVTIAAEVIRGRNDRDLDDAKRANDRWIERERFQFQTLVELQDAIYEAMPVVDHLFQRRFEAGVPSEHVVNEMFPVLERLEILGSRLSDDRARQLTKELHDAAVALLGSENEAAAHVASTPYFDAIRAARARAGELIRATYSEAPDAGRQPRT